MVKRYLYLCSLDHAVTLMKSSFPKVKRIESVQVANSLGRVVATSVYAPYSVPSVNLAAMDGYAVASRDTRGATDQAPMALAHHMPINTGNILPPEFDAVIMIEETWEEGDIIKIRKPAIPSQYVHRAGEDIREYQLLLAEGDKIRAFDIGALTTYGITHLDVRAVKIGLIPTGSELVPTGTRPLPGQVVESNTLMAKLFLSEMGGCCIRYPIVRDDSDTIEETLQRAIRENDFVIISAGSSAGTRDYTEGIISSLGELLYHGVAMKPGKPVILGRIEGKPVLGLPGFPTAAQTVLREFAVPLLESWGLPAPTRQILSGSLAYSLASDLGFDEFVPVSMGRIGNMYWAVPQSRGSGAQMATVRANGFIHIPPSVEGYETGTEIDVMLTSDRVIIEKTLILSGTHDPVLDELERELRRNDILPRMRNSGNMGGILSLTRNSCHAALMGLPEFAQLARCECILSNINFSCLIFVHVATIRQGIASRNSIEIQDLPHVRIINREIGSAPRITFDELLSTQGIDPSTVEGYRNQVTSHLAVATAIRDGRADAGMCSSSVAKECGLRFIPVAAEHYELVVRREMIDDPKIRVLISLIGSALFIKTFQDVAGYDMSRTGAIRYISEDYSVNELSSIDSFVT